MIRFSLTSLRVQAILWTLLPLTIIFLIIVSVGLFAYTEVVGRLVQDRNRELARLSADRLSENVVEHAGVLRALAADEGMRNERCLAASRAGSEAESDCFAIQNMRLDTAISRALLHSFDGGVTIFRADGTPRMSKLSIATGFDAAGQPEIKPAWRILRTEQSYLNERFFREVALAQETGHRPQFFSDIIYGNESEDRLLAEPQIIVSVPILGPRNELIGVIAGSFLLRNGALGKEIAKLGVDTAYLVDRQGRVIWHAQPEFLGQDFSMRTEIKNLLLLKSSADAQRGVNEQGESVSTGYARVSATGWGLIVQEPWANVIGPVRTFQWIMVGTLLVGLLLVMVIISSGTRRLTEPISELVSQAEQLSRGDYVGTVHGGTINEMRSLAQAFNEMADRVARYRAGLQSYVAAITRSQEEERRRIARELHDDTIQSLIALGRRLELMEQSLENPIEMAKQLYQLHRMLNDTVAEVRQFSRDLRPLLLEDLGLEAALRQILREMEERLDMETEFRIAGAPPSSGLDDELEVALYRIAQEALNNIRKHAQATYMKVSLAYEENEVILLVEDNGIGFPMAETADLARQGAFGLMGIRERSNLLGGSFDIQSVPGEGTSVRVSLPFSVPPEWVLTELQGVSLPNLAM